MSKLEVDEKKSYYAKIKMLCKSLKILGHHPLETKQYAMCS